MARARFPRRVVAVLVAAGGVATIAPAPHAADPQPYTVTLGRTGDGALDAALSGSSDLVSLRQTAPVGPFALVARARDDHARFATALQSFGYFKG
jgi:translocation and assembly module TamA